MSRNFTKNAITNFKNTGTIFPSSRYLSKKICSLIPNNAQTVIELGAGNGAVTKHLLNHIAPTANLSSYEINEEFITHLKQTFQDDRFTILEHSALEMPNDFKAGSVDVIASCLPLALFDEQMKRDLLKVIKESLKVGGLFIQYQYSLKDKKLIAEYFPRTEVKFVLRNAPPAFIYLCEK